MTFKEKTLELVGQETFVVLQKYVDLIEEYNKVMNLTGFKEDRLWEEGIYESLVSLQEYIPNEDVHLLDIGAGAGFPSVPFLIANPNITLTIYEPMKKRVKFLEIVKEKLGIKIDIQNTRAETAINDKECFDFVTARAVVNFKTLAEISHLVAKVNGTFVWVKGPRAKEEIEASHWIIKKLEIAPVLKEIKVGNKSVNIISYKKKKTTPSGFPREWQKIIK